jgi:hypothetical protein
MILDEDHNISDVYVENICGYNLLLLTLNAYYTTDCSSFIKQIIFWQPYKYRFEDQVVSFHTPHPYTIWPIRQEAWYVSITSIDNLNALEYQLGVTKDKLHLSP